MEILFPQLEFKINMETTIDDFSWLTLGWQIFFVIFWATIIFLVYRFIKRFRKIAYDKKD